MAYALTVFNSFICRGWEIDSSMSSISKLSETQARPSQWWTASKPWASIHTEAESKEESTTVAVAPPFEYISQQTHSCLPTRDQELSNWAAPSSRDTKSTASACLKYLCWRLGLSMWRRNKCGNLKPTGRFLPWVFFRATVRMNHHSTQNHSASCLPPSHTSRASGSQAEGTLGHCPLLCSGLF